MVARGDEILAQGAYGLADRERGRMMTMNTRLRSARGLSVIPLLRAENAGGVRQIEARPLVLGCGASSLHSHGCPMRRTIRFALIASLSLVGAPAFAQEPTHAASADTAPEAPSVAVGADSLEARLASSRARLIGRWEEYSPSRNFIDFLDDGRVVLHLKRGEIGERKTLEGDWRIEQENQLRIDFTLNEQTFGRIAELRFENGELLLKEPDAAGAVTRHRRYEGELPEEYRW